MHKKTHTSVPNCQNLVRLYMLRHYRFRLYLSAIMTCLNFDASEKENEKSSVLAHQCRRQSARSSAPEIWTRWNFSGLKRRDGPGDAGVAFPAVLFPSRNCARKGEDERREGGRNKSVALSLASLIAVSPPAFEQEDSSGLEGRVETGTRAKGDVAGERARTRAERGNWGRMAMLEAGGG